MCRVFSGRYCVILLGFFVQTLHGWPDGSPCLRNALDSMDPLEAEEHQGGLQLTPPPYQIILDTSCYRTGEPIRVTLLGNNATFKGFALQARIFEGDGSEPTRRVGQFFREDDNGAWRFQCFRNHDGITHSYPTKKKELGFNWQTDFDDGKDIQFIATVVESRKRFWVRSVVSVPIPSCRFASHFNNFVPKSITAPPPLKRTKFGFLTNFNTDNAPQSGPVEPHVEVKPETFQKPPIEQAPFVPPPSPPSVEQAPFFPPLSLPPVEQAPFVPPPPPPPPPRKGGRRRNGGRRRKGGRRRNGGKRRKGGRRRNSG